MSSDVIVGVGNRMRGDDAAGPIVLDRLRERLDGSVPLLECDGDVSDLIDAFRIADRVLVVDAIVSGCEPGTLHVIDGRLGIPASWRSGSTHLIGLSEAIELAWALELIPAELTIIGIEAGDVSPGDHLTDAVAAAIDRIVPRVAEMAHA